MSQQYQVRHIPPIVESINGRTGNVAILSSDSVVVETTPSHIVLKVHPEFTAGGGVESVNERKGDVVLTGDDILVNFDTDDTVAQTLDALGNKTDYITKQSKDDPHVEYTNVSSELDVDGKLITHSDLVIDNGKLTTQDVDIYGPIRFKESEASPGTPKVINGTAVSSVNLIATNLRNTISGVFNVEANEASLRSTTTNSIIVNSTGVTVSTPVGNTNVSGDLNIDDGKLTTQDVDIHGSIRFKESEASPGQPMQIYGIAVSSVNLTAANLRNTLLGEFKVEANEITHTAQEQYSVFAPSVMISAGQINIGMTSSSGVYFTTADMSGSGYGPTASIMIKATADGIIFQDLTNGRVTVPLAWDNTT
jgi:hypothetical protein